MKKNVRMPLENKMLFYVIVAIAVLNVIAYLSVEDWNSLIFFFLAGFLGYAFKLGNTLSLIVAILSANVFRATKSMREGLKNKKQPEPKNKKKGNNFQVRGGDESNIEYTSNVNEPEGFKSLKRQENLQMMTKKLGPMMDKAMQLMDRLPKGFLDKA